MLYDQKRTWAEVKINALQYNTYKIRGLLPENCKFMALVKANAYGHGLVEVSKSLAMFHCDYLGVACLDEAKKLREANVELPILILSHTPAEFIENVVELGCIQALDSLEDAKAYSRILVRTGHTLKIHVKLETGMGRTGFDVKAGDINAVVSALSLPGIEAEGIFTHFAVADDPEREEYTLGQFRLFTDTVARIEKESGVKFAIRHCANSAAIINHPEMCLDMVRGGIALYGIYPDKRRGALELAPMMELKTRILQVFDLKPGDTVSYGCCFTADREMKAAVLAIGYGDGLHRSLSGKLDVLIGGVRCPQIGTICMDMCMADITSVPDAKADDIATIFGHDGREVIPVGEVAEKAGTISYEMLCSVAARVPRTYNN